MRAKANRGDLQYKHDSQASGSLRYVCRPTHSLASRACIGSAFGALLILLGAASTDDDMAARRARVEAMDLEAKQRLLEREQRLLSLPPAEQQRLRELHEQLQRDPQGDELRQVMHRYYEWLKTLSSSQKAELVSLSPEKRVEMIKRFTQDPGRKKGSKRTGGSEAALERLKKTLAEGHRGKRLLSQDLDGLCDWLRKYQQQLGEKTVADLPAALADRVRRDLKEIDASAGRQDLLRLLWLKSTLDASGDTFLTADDMAAISAALSPASRKRLASMPQDEQQKVARQWVEVLVSGMLASYRGEYALLAVSDKDLAAFLEREITPEQRDRLLSLSGEDMQRELAVFYWRSKLPVLPGTPPAERPQHAGQHGSPKKAEPGKDKAGHKGNRGRT